MLCTYNWRYVCWDGDVVIYDVASGDTHRLEQPAGDIVTLLSHAKNGLNLPQIAAALPVTPSPELTKGGTALESSVAALCDIGLIAPVSFENPIPLADRTLPSAQK